MTQSSAIAIDGAPDAPQDVSAAALRTQPRAARRWGAVLREPLLHFAVLAGLIFGADRILHPPSNSDRVITVSSELRRQLIAGFDEDQQIKPTQEQLQKLIDFYVATEILFREGKSMGLDRGDDMIKARVAHKLQLLIFSDIDVGRPSEEQLAEWFAKHRDRFDVPEKFDFYLAAAASEQEARDDVARIAAGNEPEALQETARAFQGRPAANLIASFGEAFVKQLETLPRGQWQAVQSSEGWHVARVDGVSAAAPANLEQVRSSVVEAWRTEATRLRALDAVEKLKANYTVRYEDAR